MPSPPSLRTSPVADRDVQAVHVRRQALIVLHHLDGGIVRDDTKVPLRVELSSPWRLSLNNLAMARRTGRSPHLPNHCRVIRGGFKSGAGFEPKLAPLSNLLMARDFWSKRLMPQQLRGAIDSPLFSRVRSHRPRSWRLIGDGSCHRRQDRSRLFFQ